MNLVRHCKSLHEVINDYSEGPLADPNCLTLIQKQPILLIRLRFSSADTVEALVPSYSHFL
jgi:hypothetical protein